MANITLLPSAKVPLVYDGDNTMTTEWYRFFWNIYGFTGTGVVPVNKGGTGLDTIGDHQLIIGNANNVFEPTTLVGSGITITYGAGTVTLAIGSSGVTPGTYGDAATVGQFVVDIHGTITFAQNVPIAIAASQITSGTLPVIRGGTGATTLTGYVKGNGTSAFTASATVPTTDLSGTITNAQLANSTISGVALGGNLFNLTAGTGVSFSAGTTYNGSTAITINATGSGGTVTSVTGTAPVVSSGGTTPAISMAAATGSVNGYLTSTDWTTFNSKQAALVSGTNIKTVGGVSLLGSGDVGTIGTGYGGTGLTSFTANGIVYASSTSALATGSTFNFNGTSLGFGVAGSSAYGFRQIYTGSGAASQYGMFLDSFSDSSATNATISIRAKARTSAAAYTCGTAFDFVADTIAAGAGSTITSVSGFYCADQTAGTTNIGYWSTVSSGSNKYNIYASGTASNYFNGGVSIGNTTDPGATNLSVTGSATIQTLTVGLGGGSVSTNTVLGTSAGASTNTGAGNVFLGNSAGNKNTGGANNTYTGYQAGFFNTNASSNCLYGAFAANGASFASSNNSVFGWAAGSGLTSGGNNCFFGYNAGNATTATTTGTNNIYVGYGAHGSAAGNTNEVVIGYTGAGNGSNTTTLGNSSTTATYTNSPVITSGYTVATLPTGVTGMRAYVTNALAPTYGSTVVGGGAVTIPVFYNGTNWICA